MANKILIKRGNKSSLPTLNNGEPAFVADEKELYIGTTSGNIKVSNRAEVQKMLSTGVFYSEVLGIAELSETDISQEISTYTNSNNIEYEKLCINNASDIECDSIVDYVDSIQSGYCTYLIIREGSNIYNELSSKILDEQEFYLKIEKITGQYAILTLRCENSGKILTGSYKNNIINLREVQFI